MLCRRIFQRQMIFLLRRRVLRVPFRVLDVSRWLYWFRCPCPVRSGVPRFGSTKERISLYPKDIGFFSPNPLLQQRLGLAAASSLSRPSPDSTVPIRLLNLVFVSHRLKLSLSRTAIVASRPLMAPLRAKMSRSSLRCPRHAPVAFVVAPRVLPTSPVTNQGHCHLLSCSYFLFLITSLLLFCGSRLLLFFLFLVCLCTPCCRTIAHRWPMLLSRLYRDDDRWRCFCFSLFCVTYSGDGVQG